MTTGTDYKAAQRIEAGLEAYSRARHNLRALEIEDAQRGNSGDTQSKRRMATTVRAFSRAKQRLSLACTYWLQHNPKKV